MPRVMAVSFERYGRLYYLDPGERTFHVGDRVLVPTEAGAEVAECVWAPEWIDADEGGGLVDLPVCAGPASAGDLERDADHRRRRAEAKIVARRLIKKHGLAMKIVGVDYLDPASAPEEMVVFYFTAPQRVDFRSSSASSPAASSPASTCARSVRGTPPASPTASAAAAETSAARPSSRTSSR